LDLVFQLASSFNPIIEYPKDWYGNMYLELKLDEHHSKKHTDKKEHDKSSKKSKKKEKYEK
jgi:hypothetical protein